MVNQAQPIAILGMHRSGTSCLAGSLQESGLYLGEVNTKAPANARGNRENRDIMDLHDEVLASHGFQWDRPPTYSLDWSDNQVSRLKTLIGSYPQDRLWGFKDPRTLLLLDQWKTQLPNLQLVGSLRHPASVAASLRRRNRFTWEQGYNLWLGYNDKLLTCLQRESFPVINFDQTADAYREALQDLVMRQGLKVPAEGFQFFSNGLRNDQPSDYPVLPEKVARTYQALQEYTR